MRNQFRIIIAILALCLSFTTCRADELDDYIQGQMQKCNVAGLSVAIIENGAIITARGYGVTDKKSGEPVKPTTLFLAGSVSKSVAALGALHLVDAGKIKLDKNINDVLTTWKVPENQFTVQKSVTLREILSHTAGFTVHGFPGYAVDRPLPSLTNVLDGVKPANTPAIRVDFVPGSQWRYSGGGYTVMQMAIVDITGEQFATYMQESVLTPLGMSDSTYEQPLPAGKTELTATGYLGNGNEVKGKWHVYPEMAAAGLWTTASDLARFAISIQESIAGKSNPVISKSTTKRMLTNQKNNDGLGVFLEDKGRYMRFTHNGGDAGFDTMLVAYAAIGKGAVIMINDNEKTGMSTSIMREIGKLYEWPNYPFPGLP